jgi:phosphate transport system substrate-binding protein
MTIFTRSAVYAAAIASLGLADIADATTITGAGSTFVFPVLSRWAADYKKSAGDEINYQSIGSGGGIAQIKAGTVDFGATDKPLAPEELSAAGLAQFPVVIGGVVPVINIPGAKPGQVKMSGDVLADIYAGVIKSWNDPRIAKLNPGLHFPAKDITAVHRSDGSGTTFNFTHYLSQVNGGWKSKFGEGTTVSWNGGIGGKGNEGVAGYVKQIPYSIGYVEYAYVIQNKMAYTLMQNSAGKFVSPNSKSFAAAASHANWAGAKDFFLVMTNAPGAESYPITASTFVLMYKQPKNAEGTAAAKKFFNWALTKGQPQAASLDYVPLPATLVSRIQAYSRANIH